jgi:hypothetical protein
MGSRTIKASWNRVQENASDINLLDGLTSNAKGILDGNVMKSIHDLQQNPATFESPVHSVHTGIFHAVASHNLCPMARWESETVRDQPWNAVGAFALAYKIEMRESHLPDEYSTLSTRAQNGSVVGPKSCKDEYQKQQVSS